MEMSWVLSYLEESYAKGRLEPSPLSTGLCSLLGNDHPWESMSAKDIVHHHPTNSWNGLKKRLIPLFKSLVKERGRKSYIIRGTYDSISPPQCKQIFWIPFNTPANWTSTKSQKKEPPFKVVYFSHPNIKRRGKRRPHAKLHSSKSYWIPFISTDSVSFMGSSYCAHRLNAWDPRSAFCLAHYPSLSSPCALSTSPGLQPLLPLRTPESVPVLMTSSRTFSFLSEVPAG